MKTQKQKRLIVFSLLPRLQGAPAFSNRVDVQCAMCVAYDNPSTVFDR